MVSLFNQNEAYNFFENKKLTMKEVIQRLTNDEICNTNLDDLAEYYFECYKINLIELFLDNVQHNITETKIKKYNSFYRRDGFDQEYFYIDSYKITYEIPFDGDEILLYIKPSTFTSRRFEVDNLIKPTDNSYGRIIISLNFEKTELDKKENNEANEFVKNNYNREIESYIKMANWINTDTNSYNNSLKNIISTSLQARLKKATDYIKMSEKLNIPLVQNPNAPNTKPILLKKVKKDKQLNFPTQKQKEIEYGISDADYNNIKSVINLACVSMEKSARTFYKLQEEELRDVILSNLNTHYQGTATGETFNKRGKTDIYIAFENKSAYIGECKVWHGIKKFNEAIEQLFSYMTWRDTKTSLIIFNKDAKDFKKILETVEEDLKKNNLCEKSIKTKDNEWQCVFKKYEESEERIEMNICIYDLRIDE